MDGLTLAYSQEEILTILAPEYLEDPLRRAADRLISAKANEGVNIRVIIEAFSSEEQVKILPSQLAAGLGSDIIIPGLSGLPMYSLIQNGLLADINSLMIDCPYTQRDDFFTNVLEAFEIDYRLYTFPLRFTFQYVGVNANLPEEFISRFTALDAVTYSQLMSLYGDLRQYYPDWDHMYMGTNIRPLTTVFPEQLSRNINITTRSIDITNPSFIGFLEDFQHSFAPQFLSDKVFHTSGPIQSAENFASYSNNYVFYLTNRGLDQSNAFFDFEDHYFINFIPLIGEDGNLLISQDAQRDVISVSHAANGQLAWSFISELSTRPLYHAWTGAWRSFSPPIRKNSFEENMDSALRQALSFSPSELLHFTGGQIYQPEVLHTFIPIIGQGNIEREHQMIVSSIARLYTYANMPISPVFVSQFYIPTHLYMDTLWDLLDENISASEIAERIERNIIEWLNREPTPITPYIPVESVYTGREDLPVRTLSMLSIELYEPLFLEAANRMAEEWARREYGYNFELVLNIANVSNYLPDDFTLWTTEVVSAAWEQMLMRVGVALMAGQGHDIMCLSVLTNLWSHIETGLFTDIYQLIDQCQHTSRADFFTQALAPFEMDGSLYAFPTNFGFAYVGVNEILPQSFIDRFTALDTITFPELMSIYFELRQYPEFADIAFTNADLAASPYSAFHHVLLQYIDFPNSSANLIDSSFVAFLRDFRQLYDWANHPFDRFPHMSEYAPGQDFAPGRGAMERRVIPFYHIQNVSEQYAFWIEDVYVPALTMADSADSPFLHFIPIADYRGRLTYVTSTPTLAVTAIADGDLAWEFIQHLIYVTVNPTRQAQYNDGWHAPWGKYTLNTPISRAYFETHFTENLAQIFDDTHLGEAPYTPEQVGRALAKVANYNEMPMAYRNMPIPRSLYWDILEQFIRGLITPEDAAQQLHNRISLWLIE